MKSRIVPITIIVLILSTILFSFAIERDTIIRFENKQINYMLNQSAMSNNIPLVSLELIADKYGFNYEYNEKEGTINGTIGNKSVSCRLGSKYVYSNRQKLTIDTVIKKINGNLMVPIDFVMKIFNGKASWDEKKRIINLYKDNNIEVHFIDVSQGNIILIDYKDFCILINSSGEKDGNIIRNYLRNQGIRDIQLYISTDYDPDKVTRINSIMESFNIYQVLYSGDPKEAEEIRKNITSMPSNNIIELIRYDNMNFDLSNGVEFKIEVTNKSVITKLKHNDIRILLTGDIDSEDTDIISVTDYEPNIEGTIVITTDGEIYDIDTRQFIGISIIQIDFVNQRIMIYNESNRDYDIGGCFVKDKDNNVYQIEGNLIVESGYQRIFSLIKEGDELDTNRKWIPRTNFYTDYGILYDTKGNIIAVTPKY